MWKSIFRIKVTFLRGIEYGSRSEWGYRWTNVEYFFTDRERPRGAYVPVPDTLMRVQSKTGRRQHKGLIFLFGHKSK